MRVRRIIEPIIIGRENAVNYTDDDTQYCLDLGLLKVKNGELLSFNKIYNEVIIRTLSFDTQFNLNVQVTKTWIDKNGNLEIGHS
jgi:hypothetical protein